MNLELGTPLRPLRTDPMPAPEDRAMHTAFATVEPLAPLSEIESVRLRRRLDREVARRLSRRVWLKRAVASGAGLLLLEAMAAAAVMAWPAARHRLFGDHRGSSGVEGPPVPAALPAPAPGASVSAPVPAAAPAVSRTVEPIDAPPRLRRVRPKPAAPAPAQAETAPPVSDDADVTLYSRALSQLNAHDPAGALETLRAYRLQHPRGLFGGEASVTEVRADLMLNREPEALSLLDAMHARDFAGVPQGSELALLRAELLGRAERCDEALPVLSTYLDDSTPAAQRERALYARAVCRAQTSDAEGSRQDLKDYLREFPRGRFAARVNERLKASAE